MCIKNEENSFLGISPNPKNNFPELKRTRGEEAASVPEHLMHCFKIQSVSIIHEGEAFLSIDHSLINPELFSPDIRIVGIVWGEMETQVWHIKLGLLVMESTFHHVKQLFAVEGAVQTDPNDIRDNFVGAEDQFVNQSHS